VAPAHPTNAVEIFVEMAGAAAGGVRMIPRSPGDKEYFPQDWFKDRLEAIGLPHEQQGRNSYPDFWVNGPSAIEGYEIKSLSASTGRPARKDIDFNSTIPSGRKNGREIFLVFFLYTGSGGNERAVHSISLAHGDLINADHLVADEHLNVAVHEFGSYADGFIRNRKMYVFRHPVAIDPEGFGHQRLVVPHEWEINDLRLKKVKTLERRIAAEVVDCYTIRLYGKGEADVTKRPSSDPGTHFPQVVSAVFADFLLRPASGYWP